MRRLALPLLAALALGFAVPATASAADWMIASGPGLGVYFDQEPGGTVNQPELEMAGVITPAGGACKSIHYNGTLFGKADPAPAKCGWGKVITHSANRSDSAHRLAEGITFELTALRRMQVGTFSPRQGLLGEAQGEITDTIATLGQLYPNRAKARKRIAKQLKKAKRLDAKANKSWKNGKRAKAKKALKKSTKIKRKQLKKLLQREKRKGGFG